jgi:hypothetical protein
MMLACVCVPDQRWQHADQDRKERNGNADCDERCRKRFALIGNRPQRSENGGTDDERKEKLQARVRRLSPLLCRAATPLEVADLPEQRAGYGQFDCDGRLEKLDRNVHCAPVSTARRPASTASTPCVGRLRARLPEVDTAF